MIPYQQLLAYLNETKINYKLISHPECKTSKESALARASAGEKDAVGAKALLLKVNLTKNEYCFKLIVLPGFSKIDNAALKKVMPKINRFRFSTKEEIANVMNGLIPGTVPPFGNVIFPKIIETLVDEKLFTHKAIGFNAACLDHSIIMDSSDYIVIAGKHSIVNISEEIIPVE